MTLFKITQPTFNNWRKNGIPSVVENGKVYFDEEQVLNWNASIRESINELEIGKEYHNKMISETFKCSEQGGMRRSHLSNTLVLFSDHTKGVYEDKTILDENGNEMLLYTGMGQKDDQDINFGQNKTLNESKELSIKIYMFEAFHPGKHIFRGEVKLVQAPYTTDQFGRQVWIFPLAYIENEYYISEEMADEKDKRQEQAANKLNDEELYELANEVEKVGERKAITKVYVRNHHVTAHVKRRAKGLCDLCGKPAPFYDKNGLPYLECHHVDWLAHGGKDGIDNAVALDPSCHRKMHILDLPNDVKLLKEKIVEYQNKNQ